MPPPEPDARCWSCGAPAPARRIEVESVIRGRPAADGGPYRVLRCPACRAWNGVLAGPRGGWMLYPLAGLEEPGLLDHLLSLAERSRLARARTWWHEHRGEVERFRRGIGPPPRAPAPESPPPHRPPPRPAPPRPAPPPRRREPARTGPRAVLGVPDDATLDEVRRAFRRLAKRHHPDRAQDPVAAAERFREIRAAYESLQRELGS